MNRLRAVLPTGAKKYLWNMKYGLLRYPLLDAPEDAVIYLANHLEQRAELLELGCGRGSLVRALRKTGWNGHYCGVDISENAIKDARTFGDQRSSWVVSDFESFQSPFQWNTIAMIESIYYLKLSAVPALLDRLAKMLTENGTLLLRLHDVKEHYEYVETVRQLFAGSKWLSGNLLCLVGGSAETVEPQGCDMYSAATGTS